MEPFKSQAAAAQVPEADSGRAGLRYSRGMQRYLETTTPDISGGRLLH
jgi:hypothetical protein